MATPLPRPLSHANGCLTFQKLLLTVAPGGHWQANRSSMKPFAIGAARLAALGYFTVTGCIPQPWLASAGPRGYRRNQSKISIRHGQELDNVTTSAPFRLPCLPFSRLR